MAIKFKTKIGWDITIAESVAEVKNGFYILENNLPTLIAIVENRFGGKVETIAQAKELMNDGLIKLK